MKLGGTNCCADATLSNTTISNATILTEAAVSGARQEVRNQMITSTFLASPGCRLNPSLGSKVWSQPLLRIKKSSLDLIKCIAKNREAVSFLERCDDSLIETTLGRELLAQGVEWDIAGTRNLDQPFRLICQMRTRCRIVDITVGTHAATAVIADRRFAIEAIM